MTLPEQAGKVASGAIEALKGNPGLLTVVLLQLATFVALYFITMRNAEHRQAREMYLLERCIDGHRNKE
jgi:hypothetical protein